VRPDVFLFENVRGLLRKTFTQYVRWIQLYLSSPAIERKPLESHSQHLQRLEGALPNAWYDVIVVPVNAADYGVPQKRHRVVIAGVRRGLGVELALPAPTHTQERLVWEKWVRRVLDATRAQAAQPFFHVIARIEAAS